MGFLPDNYEPPVSGNYMKLQLGANKIRVLGSAIVGNEFWVNEDGGRKPVRRRVHEVIEADELGYDQHGKRERPKHFWAFPVWNYGGKQVQILEVTQRTIQESLRGLAESPDWGDPTGYDITITKSGSGLDTEYLVQPVPHRPIDPAILAEYERLNIDMEALFDGGDPFANAGAPSSGTTNGRAQPPDEPQGNDTIATILGVKTTKNKHGKDVWLVQTDQGEFGTSDPILGSQAGRLKGTVMEITYQDVGGGARRALSWRPAVKSTATAIAPQHEPIDDDDIPF